MSTVKLDDKQGRYTQSNRSAEILVNSLNAEIHVSEYMGRCFKMKILLIILIFGKYKSLRSYPHLVLKVVLEF